MPDSLTLLVLAFLGGLAVGLVAWHRPKRVLEHGIAALEGQRERLQGEARQHAERLSFLEAQLEAGRRAIQEVERTALGLTARVGEIVAERQVLAVASEGERAALDRALVWRTA